MLSKRILRNMAGRPIPNKCFPGYFGLSFFKKKLNSNLNFWINFNKISNNLFFKFSSVRSSVSYIVSLNKLNIRRLLNRLYFLRTKVANKRKAGRSKIKGGGYVSLLRVGSLNFEKKKKFWVNSRLWEKKACLFYGINNIKKFRRLKMNLFCSSKLRLSGGLRLELQLNIILFKMGIFGNNIFLINKQIRQGLFFINGRPIKNPLRVVKLADNIHINPKFRKQIHKNFINKMRSRLIFLKLPSYIEYNFNILYFSLIRLPSRSEVLRFYYGAFHLTNSTALNFANNKESLK